MFIWLAVAGLFVFGSAWKFLFRRSISVSFRIYYSWELGLFTYTGQHRLSSHFWSSMQAGWCRSRNKPLISARPRLASALLPVDSSLGRRNYIWEWKKKKKAVRKVCLIRLKQLQLQRIGKANQFNNEECLKEFSSICCRSFPRWFIFLPFSPDVTT